MTSHTVLCLSPSFGSTSPAAAAEIQASGGVLVRAEDDGSGGWTVDEDVLARTRAIIVGTQPIDASVFTRAPRLAIVAKHGAGIDNIDVAAATAAGVAVTNAPGANATAVAELTLGLIIGLARGIVHQDARVRDGQWGVVVGKALEDATLGIVGLGQIGRLVACRALAFDLRILAYDVAAAASAAPDDPWTFTDLPTLLASSDFVTVHVPLMPETTGLIDADALRRMRPTAFLVNAARGGIVDEVALERALAAGEIAGAALDVFSEEPPGTGHPLVRLRDRSILTPHMAAYTDRALEKTSLVTARNVVAALGGAWPPDAVNDAPPSASPRGRP